MPKRVKQKRKAALPDPSEWAHKMMTESTAEPEPVPVITPAALSAYMAALGRRGGKIGGKRRLVTMTQEQRSAVGLKAAKARWKKAKSAKRG